MKPKRWVLKLILDETPTASTEDELITQLERTRAIGRAASSLQAQLDGLKIVDYRIHCDGIEQPSAESLEAVKKLLAR